MLHSAGISRLRKLSILMITIQIKLLRTALLSIFTNISVTYTRTQRGPRRAYKYRRRVPRTVRGTKEAPRFPPTRTVLLCYPTTSTIIIHTLGYQASLLIIIRVSNKDQVALQLHGGLRTRYTCAVEVQEGVAIYRRPGSKLYFGAISS